MSYKQQVYVTDKNNNNNWRIRANNMQTTPSFIFPSSYCKLEVKTAINNGEQQ